jgi:hypothetical protein
MVDKAGAYVLPPHMKLLPCCRSPILFLYHNGSHYEPLVVSARAEVLHHTLADRQRELLCFDSAHAPTMCILEAACQAMMRDTTAEQAPLPVPLLPRVLTAACGTPATIPIPEGARPSLLLQPHVRNASMLVGNVASGAAGSLSHVPGSSAEAAPAPAGPGEDAAQGGGALTRSCKRAKLAPQAAAELLPPAGDPAQAQPRGTKRPASVLEAPLMWLPADSADDPAQAQPWGNKRFKHAHPPHGGLPTAPAAGGAGTTPVLRLRLPVPPRPRLRVPSPGIAASPGAPLPATHTQFLTTKPHQIGQHPGKRQCSRGGEDASMRDAPQRDQQRLGDDLDIVEQ